MNDTAMTVRCYKYFAQPLSPAVSRGNKLYNTNSPSTNLMNIIRNYSHLCACGTTVGPATIQGQCLLCLELLRRLIFVCMWHYSRYSYYLRAMFTLLRAPECAANICVHVALQ